MDNETVKEQLKKIVQAQLKVSVAAKTVKAVLAAEKATEALEQ